MKTLDINYFNTIKFTNSIITSLPKDAKIIVLGSRDGWLKNQSSEIQDKLNNIKTEKDIKMVAEQFIQ